MNLQPLSLFNERIQARQHSVLKVMLDITAAKTVSLIPAQIGFPIVTGFDTGGNLTTAALNTFLEIDNDIMGDVVFDSTSLGADTLGFVIDMKGQARRAVAILAKVVTTAGGTPAVTEKKVNGVTNQLSSSYSSSFATSPKGNLYGRVTGLGNLDAGTTGYIVLEIHFAAV